MLITVDDITKQYTKPLTTEQNVRLPDDIAMCQQVLEGWARQKFEPVTITDERHRLSGAPLFLKWGRPDGPVTVKMGSKTANGVTQDLLPDEHGTGVWFPMPYRPYAYITYTVDVSIVQDYLESIKTIITRAVIGSLMRPDIVRFKVINSYSVEGLSIQYNQGASTGTPDMTSGEFDWQDLSVLANIKRKLIV